MTTRKSRRSMERPSEPNRPIATPDRTLHMVGNAHLDPVWLWPWQEGYAEARATFASAIQRMEEYPDFVFTCDQMVLLSWVEESDPELFEQIKRRTAEGRWQMTGGWWIEPDCNMPSGESFVRQGLYGQRYLQEKFGITATVGMNVDPFGHHAMLPQILKGQGMDSYCFMRPGPHESELEGNVFWWQSPDGSRVLAYRIPFEYCSPPGDVGGQTEKSLGQLDRSLGDLMIFYGVGNHGGGPTKANIESIQRYDQLGSFGRMTMSSPRRYFDELTARRGSAAMEALPTWTDDLQHHAPGCYSAHSGIKLWQRKAQAAILSAERWAAISTFRDGLDYPREELERAWKQILFNQFHDVLPGSAIESAYDDARDQLGEAIAISKRLITKSHNVIARQVQVDRMDGTQPVLVFNPHPWSVRANLEMQYGVQPTGVHVVDDQGSVTVSQRIQSVATTDDKGRGAVAFEADLPAFGYRLYRMIGGRPADGASWSAEPPGALSATENMIENDVLRLELDPKTGWLSSLLDKRTGVDLMAGAVGAHTQIAPDSTDTWGHRVISYALPGEAMQLDRIILREHGDLRAVIRVERSWGRSTMVEEFVLGHRDDAVEVRVTIDWREQAHLMKIRFPVALKDPEATYEIPFGSLGRPVDGAEEPAQSWVDLTGDVKGSGRAGLAVINNAKHGYDVSPQTGGGRRPDSPSIGVTAVRSPVYSWHDPRLLEDDGIYSYQDQGIQRFSYQLVPHGDDWRDVDLVRRAAQLGSSPRAMLESFHDGDLAPHHSFADDGRGQVMITAIKGSEDLNGEQTDLIVRAVETTGRPAPTAELSLPVVGRTITEDFGPSQIRTFKVPVDQAKPIVEVNLLEWKADD